MLKSLSVFIALAVFYTVTYGVVLSDVSPFLKTPYLLYEGSNSEMTVAWQLEDTQQCTLEWGTDTTYSLGNVQTTEYGSDHQHLYTIPALSPGTQYFYQVSCSGIFYPGSFFSAPPVTATDIKFFVYGDTRTNYLTHDLVALGMISAYTSDPDYQTIVFAGGDMVEFGATDSFWQKEFFNDSLSNLRQRMRELPYVACLGNHELYYVDYTGIDLDTPLFGKYFPFPFVDRRYWSLDYGPVHVTIVDQYPDYYTITSPGLISAEELAWIESDLSSSDRPWKFILLHEPGWSAGSYYFPENNADVQNLLQPLCEEYGVQIVFGGHNHYYARGCKNGVYHLTVGGGGAPLYSPYPDYPNLIYTHVDNHFCKIEIAGDILYVSIVTPGNEEFDSFEIDLTAEVNHLLGFVTVGTGSGNVEDVLISANGTSDSPDEIGYYGMFLDPGLYDVTASLEGYVTQTFDDTEIIAGTETTLDITMYATSIGDIEIMYETYLLPSVPNPFSTVTTIGYQLTAASAVELSIYSIDGRLIRTLASDQEPAGDHSVTWNGTDDVGREVPSGIYIYRLVAGEHSETRSLVLIR